MEAINIVKIPRVEREGKRVLTTEQLAEFYGCKAIQIHQNFKNHKKRFIEGKHYFRLKGADLRAFKDSLDDVEEVVGSNAPSLILWTERGASRHCKILESDRAWEMFDILENGYFRKSPSIDGQKLDEIISNKVAEAFDYQKLREIVSSEVAEAMNARHQNKPSLDGGDVHYLGDTRLELNRLVGVFAWKLKISRVIAWTILYKYHDFLYGTSIVKDKEAFMDKAGIKKMPTVGYIESAGLADSCLSTMHKLLDFLDSVEQ